MRDGRIAVRGSSFMARPDPIHSRQFAVQVVRKLREAGHVALWAGGCVRDQLLGREPKDYDIATSATPGQIQQVFGPKRTLAVGASFGVITVLGPREAGQLDVATFRQDATYSDGRHPDAVTFSTPQIDAQRRDFTINGLFFDPLREEVIDYVGGQADLEREMIRAIGDPAARFAEDKLRMLRAVRFACAMSFEIEPATLAAIQVAADGITVVSAERIAEELRKMFLHPARHRALALLRQTKLLEHVFPFAGEVWPLQEPGDRERSEAWDRTIRLLDKLAAPTVAVAFAGLLREACLRRTPDGVALVKQFASDLRLANDERDGMIFVLEHESLIRRASTAYWPTLQRVLIAPRCSELLEFAEAVALVVDGHAREIDYCREKRALPSEQWNPPPCLSGDDLRALEIPAGPIYKQLLEQARDAQLLGQLSSREAALEWVRKRWQRSE